MLKTVFIILIILCAANVFAQTPDERHAKIRAAMENKDFGAAFTELQNFRKADAKTFEVNNYDYLFGRVALKRKDLATAATAFQAVIRRNSALRAHALWHLSETIRASGNLNLERSYLQQLITISPNSLLLENANLRLLQSFYESRDYNAVITHKSIVSRENFPAKTGAADNSAKLREGLVLLGNAYFRAGGKAQAREIFNRLSTKSPNAAQPDDFALAAIRALDEMDAVNPADYEKTAPVLPEAEHLRRAQIYRFNRDFARAKLHFAAVQERFANSPNRADALLQLGRIAVQENSWDEAIKFFARVQAEFPNDTAARDAANFAAGAFARAGNFDEAIARYQKFIESGANEEIDSPERPFLNLIDALRDKGRDADALVWARQTQEKFKDELPAALALFSAARIHLSQNNFAAALTSLRELENAADLGGTRVAGGTNETEITFLIAFCLEKLGRFEEAMRGYLSIIDGRAEYYGGRATERLKAFGSNEKSRVLLENKLEDARQTAKQSASGGDFERARQAAHTALRLTDDAAIRAEMFDVARRAYQVLPAYKNAPNANILPLGRQNLRNANEPAPPNQNSHQTLADEFLFLSLYDEAAPELAQVQRPALIPNPKSKVQSPKIDDFAFTLATFYKRGDLAHKAVAFAEPLWREIPPDYLLEIAPRVSVELLYPTPYVESLLEFAPPRSIDPRFALAIMRQESRYQADVKSNAAARGLMQFIPATAAQIAVELNQKSFVPNDLYDAPTAILFGSQYLNNIFKDFPAQPHAVAASYNGGETNMTRWLVRSRDIEADKYVPEIQFSQSKDYVYKVMENYRVYQTLYDEKLQPK